jgi:hypothetical protein
MRDTLCFSTLKEMYDCLGTLHFLNRYDPTFEIIEFNDRYFNPLSGNYRDLQLTIRFNNVVAELQLNTGVMQAVKDGSGHGTFEVQREIIAAIRASSGERCRKILQWATEKLDEGEGRTVG